MHLALTNISLKHPHSSNHRIRCCNDCQSLTFNSYSVVVIVVVDDVAVVFCGELITHCSKCIQKRFLCWIY